MELRIADMFASIEGEGHCVGMPTFFVRMAGCSVVKCPIRKECDTDYSLKQTLTIDEALNAICSHAKSKRVCFTGGEPMDQADSLEALAIELRRLCYRIALQTSGLYCVDRDLFDWVCVSPKCAAMDLSVKSGDELKLVWTGKDNIAILANFHDRTRFTHYFLQPLWRADGTSNVAETADIVMKAERASCGPWRLSVQAHKYAGLK